MHELWSSLAAASGRTLSPEQLASFDRFLELLIEANETMNLTRVTEPEKARLLHVADALTLLAYIPLDTKLLADVGSGGGVPGIPLAIALPETKVVMVEATGKKCVFLRATAASLGLKNVDVRHARAEEVGRNVTLRDSCDVVTARAVGVLAWLAEWCLPLARKGGKMLAMKGPKLVEELVLADRAIKALNGGPPVVHQVTTLPGQTGHVICEIVKLGKTDPLLPRAASLAKGKHL